jgi:ribosome recycling factor
MINELKSKMDDASNKAIKSLKGQLSKVRTGRASANVLDGITVDYYGSPTPINQVGQVSTPEARLLQIQPFDKSIIGAIEKAILGSNIGLTPSNDGNLIRIPFPALTEEKRKDLVRDVKKMGEETKVAIRNSRRDQNEAIKSAEKAKDLTEDDSKKYQKEIQDITDKYVAQVDEVIAAKEKELLTV